MSQIAPYVFHIANFPRCPQSSHFPTCPKLPYTSQIALYVPNCPICPQSSHSPTCPKLPYMSQIALYVPNSVIVLHVPNCPTCPKFPYISQIALYVPNSVIVLHVPNCPICPQSPRLAGFNFGRIQISGKIRLWSVKAFEGWLSSKHICHFLSCLLGCVCIKLQEHLSFLVMPIRLCLH